jgi:O-succinylbenzoate synthase
MDRLKNLRIKGIGEIKIYTVKLPLKTPFETSFSIQRVREALLIKLSSGSVSGWGESVTSPDPFYSYETNFTSLNILEKYIFPILKRLRNFTIFDFLKEIERIRGYSMAKAAVENGLLDLIAKQNNLPLFELIGGKKKKIPSGISIGIKENISELIESIEIALDKGYHRIKIKIKKGKDYKIVEKIRERFPDIKLMVDANSDYTLKDIDILRKLDNFNLMMIEQPLSYYDIHDHSILQKEIKTPICLDESIKTISDTKTAIRLGACKIINIKQGRVGGIIKAIEIAKLSAKNNIKIWSGGMLETGIGRAFNIHMQTLPYFTLPGDTSSTERYFDEDIIDKTIMLDKKGFIDIPEGIGTGVNIIEERIEKYSYI